MTVARRRRLALGGGGSMREPRAGLVDEVDGAVRQPVVAQVALGQLRGRLERVVGVADVVVRLVPAAQALEDLHRLLDRRLVDDDLLQPAGQRAVLLDVLELLERRRPDDAQFAGGEDRLDERREIERAAGGGAGADGRVDLVDEENRQRLRASSAAMTALKRSSKSPRKRVPASSAAVSSEKTSAPFRMSGTSSSSRRWARPSASAVLPTPASPTNTGLFLRRRQRISSVRLQFDRAADERIELAARARAR